MIDKENTFTVRAVKRRIRLHRNVVESPFLAIFKNEQDSAQCNFEVGPALHDGVGPDDLQRPHPTSTIINSIKKSVTITAIITNYCWEKAGNGFFTFYKHSMDYICNTHTHTDTQLLFLF